MKGAFNNILDAVGRTPIVRLNAVGAHVDSTLHVKCEFMNPGGSVKDRPALQIIEDYEAEGKLTPGGTIVEATSGNTGMGLAMAAAVKGYKCIFVMPDKMSQEKILALRAFGAKVMVTPTNVEPDDPRSYYCVARRMVQETPNAVLANQYHNPSNPKAHVLTTGPEIWEQTGGEIDAMVISMGTGGTISGIGSYLKEKNPDIRIVGIDPIGSIYYDYFRTGKITTAHTYKAEGFGEDFLPTTMDFSIVDDVVRVSDKETFLMTRRLVREEGLYAGGSSGAAVAGMIKWAERQVKPMNIVSIACDSAMRYLSKIFDDEWMRENGFIDPEFAGRVADVLAMRKRQLYSVLPSSSVNDVIEMMRSHGLSQLPVIEDGRLLGIVDELQLMQALVDGAAENAPVGEFAGTEFAIVEPSNSAALLSELLARGKTIVVQHQGQPTAVLTKIDLIDYIAAKLR